MSKSLQMLPLILVIFLSLATGPVAMAGTDADLADWGYENVTKNGQLSFRKLSDMFHAQPPDLPFSFFIDQKLSCRKAIASDRKNYNLSDDFFDRLNVAEGLMRLVEDQYVVGSACGAGHCLTKGLIILDVQNRWAAFGMIHDEDFWNYEDGDWRRRQYSEEFRKDFDTPHFSLFLVDKSDDVFKTNAQKLTREWMDGYSLSKGYVSEYDDRRYYADDLPLKTYNVRCDQQALPDNATQ